jgi:tetratricopeptide (TPR) repeat protein
MARKVAVIWIALLTAGWCSLPASAQEEYVYLINNSGKVALTGFRLKGKKGILTALHGVCGGGSITAKPVKGDVFTHLNVTEVDIEHDLAVLSNDELAKLDANGLEPAENVKWETIERVWVMGFPEPINLQSLVTPLSARPGQQLVKLEVAVGQENLPGIKDRGSPAINIPVLQLSGALRHGHSGAPVLDGKWRVLAVGNGGIEKIDQGWAIPLPDINNLKGVTKNDRKLAKLGEEKLSGGFSVSLTPQALEDGVQQLREDIVPRLDKIASELRELRRDGAELRDLLRKKDEETAFLQRALGEVKGNVGAFSALEPDNKSLKVLADRVEDIIGKIQQKYKPDDMPLPLKDLCEKHQADAALARSRFSDVLKIQNADKLRRLKADYANARSEYTDALYQRARALQGISKLEEAASSYEELLQVDPGLNGAETGLTECYLKLNRLGDALKVMDEIVARRQKIVDQGCKVMELGLAGAKLTRAVLYNLVVDLRQLDPSLDDQIKKLGLPKRNDSELSRLKDTAIDDSRYAIEKFQFYAQSDSPKRVSWLSLYLLGVSHYANGVALAHNGRAKDAIVEYKAALSSFSDFKQQAQGDDDSSIQFDVSQLAEIHARLGSLYSDKKDYESGITSFSEAIDLLELRIRDNKSPLRIPLADALLGRATCYIGLGDDRKLGDLRKDLIQAKLLYQAVRSNNPKLYDFKIEVIQRTLDKLDTKP